MPSILRRTFNNIFWLFIGEVCAKGVVFLTTLYLARVLGIDGFGKFSLALATSTYMDLCGHGDYRLWHKEIARTGRRFQNFSGYLIHSGLCWQLFLLILIVFFILNIPLT